MNITIRDHQGIQVLCIHEKHLDAGNVDIFRQEVSEKLQGLTQVVFDLSELEFVDSSGLGAFLSCMRTLAGRGGQLCLCSVTAPVRTLFELVQMHRILPIYNSQEESVNSFRDTGREPQG